jgi:methylmalonyl-CoA mutase C-terminal domain/subunit
MAKASKTSATKTAKPTATAPAAPQDERYKVLLSKPGLDGHDRGVKVVARALRDAGFEVIYTGLFQTPEMIVEAALQEDVDAVAMSILSGAHMTLFPRVKELLDERGGNDILVTGGGIIPEEDMAELSKKGIGRLFGPGSSLEDIINYMRTTLRERRAARMR